LNYVENEIQPTAQAMANDEESGEWNNVVNVPNKYGTGKGADIVTAYRFGDTTTPPAEPQ